MSYQMGLRVVLAGALIGALSACSSGGGSKTTGAAGASGGTAGGTAGGAAGSTASGTAGSTASGGAGGSAAGSSGAAGGTGSGMAGGAGGPPTAGGPPGDAATEAGATSCSGRAISLSSNGTGTMSDAARARVVIDLMDDMPLANMTVTIEFWMYVQPTDWVAEKNEIFLYGNGGGKQEIGLDFGTPAVKSDGGMPDNHATLNPYTNGVFDDDNGVYLGITSTAAQWMHVAMTWDGMALRTYVNGEVRITTMNGNQMLQLMKGPLTMGCNPPTYNCFSGMFDELRVWNVARTADEIMANYNKAVVGNEMGLVGYWKFDDAPGSATAADSVTTAGHTAHPGVLMSATDAGAPTFVTPTPPSPVACP